VSRSVRFVWAGCELKDHAVEAGRVRDLVDTREVDS